MNEIEALVKFWKVYMKERKSYEAYQQEKGYQLDYKRWSDYLEAKQKAYDELVKIIPEIRYTNFWRDVTSLRPEAVIQDIARYRKEQEQAKERRAAERAALAGTAVTL